MPVPQTKAQKIFGVNPLRDTLSTVASHAKNLVAGPYHALTDAPTQQELIDERNHPLLFGSDPDAVTRGFSRMFVEPTFNALRDARNLHRAGGQQASWIAPSSYDAQANNVPTAGSKLVDAIPIYGPLSRSYSDEVHKKGVLPATAGLGVDMFAPKGLGKVAEVARGAAPGIAEWALGAEKGTGGSILEDTQGLTPEAVARSARDTVKDLRPQMQKIAQDASGKVDLRDVIRSIDEARQRAQADGDVAAVNHLGNLRSRFVGGAWYGGPQNVSAQPPLGAFHIMEGLQNPTAYNPEAVNSSLVMNAARDAASNIGSKLDSSLGPGFERLRQHASRLNSIADSADETRLNPSRLQQNLTKRITDVGSGLASGWAEGAGVDPLVSPAIGNMFAAALPDSSTAGMGVARSLNSPITAGAASVAGLGGIVTPVRSQGNTGGGGAQGTLGEFSSPPSDPDSATSNLVTSQVKQEFNTPSDSKPSDHEEPEVRPTYDVFHSSQPSLSPEFSGYLASSSISPGANNGARATGLLQYDPTTNPFFKYLQPHQDGTPSTTRTGPGDFATRQANEGGSEQRFQEPPLTLKSLAPAAFPSGGTPKVNLYGWTEYQ